MTLRETINDIWFSSTDIYDDKFEETGTERGIFLDEYNIIKIIFLSICITMVGKYYSFSFRVSGYIKARIEFVFTTILWSNGNRSSIKIWKGSCNNSGRRVFGCGKLTQGSSNSRILIDETLCLNITKNGTHYDQSIFRLSWISSVARKEGIF